MMANQKQNLQSLEGGHFFFFSVGDKYSVMKDMVMHCKTKLFKIKKISSFG